MTDDTTDEQARRICHLAVAGEKWQIRQLLTPETVNARHLGWTPLMWAANQPDDRCCGVVLHLLQAGADATAACEFHRTAMHLAAAANNTAVMQLLHAHCNSVLDQRTRLGDTPLMTAVACNCEEAVQLLLDLGANVRVRNNLGSSAGDKAEIYKCCRSVRNQFMDQTEANAIMEDLERDRLARHLCHLSFLGRISELKRLVDSSNVDDTSNGFTPLMHAAMAPSNRGLTCASHLLQVGADAFSIDGSKNSAMHVAAKFNNVELMRLLHAHNNSLVNASARDGATPLMWAIAADQVEAVKLLVDLGADTRLKDNQGATLFDIALQSESLVSYSVIPCNENSRK